MDVMCQPISDGCSKPVNFCAPMIKPIRGAIPFIRPRRKIMKFDAGTIGLNQRL